MRKDVENNICKHGYTVFDSSYLRDFILPLAFFSDACGEQSRPSFEPYHLLSQPSFCHTGAKQSRLYLNLYI